MRRGPGGVSRLLGAYLSYALGDAAAKWVVSDLPVWQVLFLRSCLGLAFLILVTGRSGLAALAALPRLRQLAPMNLANFAGWAAYYSAAVTMPLPQLYTIYYLSPLITALLAKPMLGERIHAIHWVAACLGFAGVMVGNLSGQATLPSLLPVVLALLAASMWALAAVLYRRHVGRCGTLELVVGSNVYVGALSAPPLIWCWQPPDTRQLAALAVVTLAGLCAHWLYIGGIRRVTVAVAGPISFFALIWSVLLAWLIWRQLPSPALVAGSGLIVAAGLLLLGSEWRRIKAPGGIG